MYIKYSIILILLILLYVVTKKKESFSNINKKVLISYIYYENEESKENFEYFLNNGGIIESNDIYYLITINGHKCSLKLPRFKNVKYIFKENKCYDIGSHGLALKKINIDKYDYFILMNDTIKGPYLKNKNDNWVNIFTSKINKKCKLVGLTSSLIKKDIITKEEHKPYHIQSMLLCTDSIGIKIILPILTCKKNHKDAVEHGEYQITKDIKNKNYTTFAFFEQSFTKFNCYKERYQTIFYKTRAKLNK
jgi:hypothetical protein